MCSNDITLGARGTGFLTKVDKSRGKKFEGPDLSRRLVAVSRALAETRDGTEIYRTVRAFIQEFIDFDTLLVSMFDPESRMRRCLYCWGDGQERDVEQFDPLPLNDSPQSRAILTGQPVLCGDLLTEISEGTPVYTVGVEEDPRTPRSYLIVPMATRGRVVGSIQLQSYQPNFFAPPDIIPLAAVADHVGTALENVRLLEEAAAARRRAESAAAREATLNRVGALLYSSLDPTEVFSTATRALRAVLGAHRATFFTYSAEGPHLVAAYEDRRAHAPQLAGSRVVVSKIPPVIIDQLQQGLPVAFADVEQESTLGRLIALYRASGDRAAIHVPIIENGSLAGLLFIGDSEPRVWEAEEVALARGVADQAAVALRQAELFLVAARSREEWERTFDAMADSVALVDKEGRLSRANRAFWTMFRLGESSLGAPLEEVMHHDNPDMIRQCEVCSARRQGQPGTFTVLRPSRSRALGRHFEVKLNRVEDRNGDFTGMVQVIRDVTALREAEAEIASRQAILDSILSSMTDATALLDLRGIIIWTNSAGERLAQESSEKLRGRHLADFFEFEDRTEMDQLFHRVRTGRFVQFERAIQAPNGDQVVLDCLLSPVVESGRVTGVVATARDVTERRASMERTAQGEKLRALGQLAAGVAHDFNNLLASILGHAQLLARMPELAEPSIARKLKAIERAARDGAETVRRIQNFTRVRTDTATETLYVRELIEQAVDIARPRWKDQAQADGAPIHLTIEAFDPSLAVMGNGTELREVLTNLIFNAVDAMPMGGEITLKAEQVGDHILMRVRDTGHGIPEETRHRIFEPFFTTRGPQNSGLGLAVSYGILHRHGGSIDVQSQPGFETVFSLKLPIARSVDDKELVKSPLATTPSALDMRVLVVDDDDAVRDVVASALAEAGADVESAGSGHEAIEMLMQSRYDLVVTDLGMPDVSGWDVARVVRRACPSARVLLLTGWGESVVPEPGNTDALDAVERVLAKPIDLDDLIDAALGPTQENSAKT